MSEDDAETLKTALEAVSKEYKQQDPPPTLLGGGPSAGAVAALVAAIERCDAYRAIAGKVLFSGGSGPVIDAHGLAVRLFEKGVRLADDVEGAVSWTTRETTGLFKAAFWGLRIDRDIPLSRNSRLMPFDCKKAMPHASRRRASKRRPLVRGFTRQCGFDRTLRGSNEASCWRRCLDWATRSTGAASGGGYSIRRCRSPAPRAS
jgi:hypothetical protein